MTKSAKQDECPGAKQEHAPAAVGELWARDTSPHTEWLLSFKISQKL